MTGRGVPAGQLKLTIFGDELPDGQVGYIAPDFQTLWRQHPREANQDLRPLLHHFGMHLMDVDPDTARAGARDHCARRGAGQRRRAGGGGGPAGGAARRMLPKGPRGRRHPFGGTGHFRRGRAARAGPRPPLAGAEPRDRHAPGPPAWPARGPLLLPPRPSRRHPRPAGDATRYGTDDGCRQCQGPGAAGRRPPLPARLPVRRRPRDRQGRGRAAREAHGPAPKLPSSSRPIRTPRGKRVRRQSSGSATSSTPRRSPRRRATRGPTGPTSLVRRRRPSRD